MMRFVLYASQTLTSKAF